MAYIKDGIVCYDEILNVSVTQTDAELLAIETAQLKQRSDSDDKIAAQKAILVRLGITSDEAALLLS